MTVEILPPHVVLVLLVYVTLSDFLSRRFFLAARVRSLR